MPLQFGLRNTSGRWASLTLWRIAVVAVLSQHLVYTAEAHIAAWHKGMYCFGGNHSGVEDFDTNTAAKPMFQLKREDWWFHHVDKCDEFPPAPGDFLELPAGGSFEVELALNRALTTHSYNGAKAGTYPDGKEHPALGVSDDGKKTADSCISDPNIHTQNETRASGTAFAISYESNIKKVRPDNLVVFSVLYHTPWRRVAIYEVPKLPACPESGCTCAWGWVPNGCGIPNMYMEGFKCRVTGQAGNAQVARAVPPVWCEDDPSKCVTGAKQMIFWHQQEGNNVFVEGYDRAGDPKSPAYNMKTGFQNGAQHDIFVENFRRRSSWWFGRS